MYATSKPSAFVEGSTVVLPSFTRLVANNTGLTSLPSKNGTLLNSMWSSHGLLSFLFSNKGVTRVIPTQTLSSKCVWDSLNTLVCAVPQSLPITSEGLPDDWYQGRVSFSDSIFLIDGSSGVSTPLYSFSDTVGIMDIVFITTTNDHRLVSFVRKQDGSLWLLKTNLISG